MTARPRVVIVGAGFGGLAAAKAMEKAPVDVVVLDRHNYHTFQPLLYQVATAGLNAADVAYVVRGLFRRTQRVAVRKALVIGVDWDSRSVLCAHEDPVPFDYLVVAAGSACNYFGIPGAEKYAFPLYTLEDAIRLRNHVLSLFEAASAVPALLDDGVLTFVVAGGGPTGVEVAGALGELIDRVLREDFHDLDISQARVMLVEAAPQLLTPFSPKSQRYAKRELERHGVEVCLNTAVTRVTEDEVTLASGDVIRTRALIWGAGVKAGGLAERLGLPTGRGGRVTVESDLSVAGHPDVFVVGDIADAPDGKGAGDRLPQLAQPAIQGGKHAAEQIVRTIHRAPRTDFRYLDKGTMATIGRRAAVAEFPTGTKLTGPVAWLAWLALHLLYLLGVRNKVSVFVNWAWNYLTWDRGPRLIIRPERLAQTAHPLSDLETIEPS